MVRNSDKGRLLDIHGDQHDFLKVLKKHLKDTPCRGDFAISYNILRNRYPKIDRAETLALWKEKGWYCDCDLLESKAP